MSARRQMRLLMQENHLEVRTPSATAVMPSMICCSVSPFPMRSPTVRFRLRSPATSRRFSLRNHCYIWRG